MTPTTPELQRVLERAVGRIRRIERNPCPYSSSWAIEELDVSLDDGTVLPMIFKNLSPDALFESARVRPDGLVNPLREIETYRAILSGRSLGTARCYAAVAEQGRYWLFLERVDGAPLWQSGDMDVWHSAARWLAQLHRQPVSMTHLLQYDRAFYTRSWQRAFSLHPELASIGPVYHRAVKRLLDLPSTFIHGEFYASNVLVRGDRICPVDWELAASAPGLMDLAALTAGTWDRQHRLDFAVAYCGSEPGAALLRAFDCCRLYQSVRLLGWAMHWQPPAVHAHDWLGEAQEIAAALA
jgi:aminoglycoside phosphotransferase (APT) family kinase protein